MQDRLKIKFAESLSCSIKILVNDALLWSGAPQEIQLDFKMLNDNQLKIHFSGVVDEIRIDKIYFNRLSLESFIYRGRYITGSGKTLCPCSHIQEDGTWIYEFNSDLAKSIIKANT